MFVILAITLAVSILVGRLAGGSVRALSYLRFRWTGVLFIALVLGVAPLALSPSRALANLLLVPAYTLVAVFLLRNIAASPIRLGVAFMFAGWLLNVTVIALNGAMPLSMWAYHASGQVEEATPGEGGFFKIEVADEETHLRFLGDVIPIRPIGQVVSLGDIGLVIGAGITIFVGMTRHTQAAVDS